MHGPGWADTLLIWTYDEHGGYYDHVAPPAAEPPDDIPGRSRVAHPSLLRGVLKVLFPGYVKHAEQLVAGPDAYDTYGFRGARRDRVTLCAAGLRPVGRIRPHLGAETHRGEVEPALAAPA